MNYKVSHSSNKIQCEIDLPSSKSISNRLLIIQALCKEKFNIINLSDSDDTIVLQETLSNVSSVFDLKDSGTALRFLTSYFSISKGSEIVLTGSSRLRERPIKDLVSSLKSIGADITYSDVLDFAPIRIKGNNFLKDEVDINAGVSSQFISSLLLIAPIIPNGLKINIIGNVVSRSYIMMTLSLMSHFGIDYLWEDNSIIIPEQDYVAKDYIVERDWSCASFWFQIAALSQFSEIKLRGLNRHSIQGDSRSVDIFSDLGVSSDFIDDGLILRNNSKYNNAPFINIINTPDMYQPLKCSLFALNLSSEIVGLDTLPHKETNRILSTEEELSKLNNTKIINTYNDHRMAMSFAPMCLKFGALQINNIEVVSKSYRKFWKDLDLAGFKVFALTR